MIGPWVVIHFSPMLPMPPCSSLRMSTRPICQAKRSISIKKPVSFAIRVPRRITTSPPHKLLAKTYIIFVQFTIPSSIQQYEMKTTLGHYGKGRLSILRKVLIVVANKCFDVWYCTTAKKKEHKFQSHSSPQELCDQRCKKALTRMYFLWPVHKQELKSQNTEFADKVKGIKGLLLRPP